MSKRRVLITGVAGFIGSNLLEALLARGDEVIGIDNFSQGNPQNLQPFLQDMRLIEDDICDEQSFQAAGRVDVLVHLAALKIPRYGNTLQTLEVNLLGTRNALEYARRLGAKLVFASTSDVYGKNPELPFRETSNLIIGPPSSRRWAYAGSKLVGEQMCFAYAEAHQVPVAILRYFGGYGPREATSWWAGPQAVFIECALNRQPLPIHGDGQQTRCLTYVSDLIEATVRAIDEPAAVGQVINVGSTREVKILELVEVVWRLINPTFPPQFEFVPYSAFGGAYEDVRRRRADITQLTQLLRFTPSVTLEEGLPKTIAWHQSLRIPAKS